MKAQLRARAGDAAAADVRFAAPLIAPGVDPDSLGEGPFEIGRIGSRSALQPDRRIGERLR